MTLKADAVLVNILAKGIQGFTNGDWHCPRVTPSRGASSGIVPREKNSLAQINPNAGRWFEQVKFN
jgi:hypothetical protein